MSKSIVAIIAIGLLVSFFMYLWISSYFASHSPETTTSLTITSTTPASKPTTTIMLNGAGSTLQAPLVVYWSDLFEKDSGIVVNYQGVGSGAGQSMFFSGVIDFAGSDVPLTHSQYLNYSGRVAQIPIAVAAVAVVYNLPELPRDVHLNFTGCLLAKIYKGEVTKWDDPAIRALNPAVADKLPDKNIITVYRSDKSGTTNIFTAYLWKSCPSEWPQNYVGLSMPSFVTTSSNSIGGKGSDGLTSIVKNNPYSIGYVELQYALSSNLQYASVENAQKEFITPINQTIYRAVENAVSYLPSSPFDDWSEAAFKLVLAPGNDSYPLTTFTFQFYWAKYSDTAKQNAVLKWVNFILTKGQENMLEGYYPLPSVLASRLLSSFGGV